MNPIPSSNPICAIFSCLSACPIVLGSALCPRVFLPSATRSTCRSRHHREAATASSRRPTQHLARSPPGLLPGCQQNVPRAWNRGRQPQRAARLVSGPSALQLLLSLPLRSRLVDRGHVLPLPACRRWCPSSLREESSRLFPWTIRQASRKRRERPRAAWFAAPAKHGTKDSVLALS